MDPFWQDLLEKLKQRLSIVGFKTFSSSVKLVSFEDGILTLAAPSPFMLKWVKESCEPHLQDIFANELKQSILLEYQVDSDIFSPPPETPPVAVEIEPKPITPASSAFNPRYTFETFVVGNNNRFAHAAAFAVANNPPASVYNPLTTIAGAGLGKTHLMHAIAQHALKQNPRLKIVYTKAEDFVNEAIDIIRENRQARWQEFRNRYRTVDILMLDDIQFFIDKGRSQEEFFHAFEALYHARKQIIISSDRAPKDLKGFEDRLASRLSGGLPTDIQPPDLETRIAILRKKIEGDPGQVTEEVLQYVARQVPSNIRELEGALNRLVAHASLTNTELTVDFAAETLKHFFAPAPGRHVTISTIKQVVSEKLKIEIEELSAKIKTKDIAMARQIAMFLAKELTTSALSKIGENFGGRDHTTVLHACDKIRESIKTDPALEDLVINLKKEILAK